MTRQHYPLQVDCISVASDRDGHVAAFVTAGIGPIPAVVLNNTESLLVNDSEEAILRLPKVSACRLIASVPRQDFAQIHIQFVVPVELFVVLCPRLLDYFDAVPREL